ncbi:MAG TPA: metallophosphoesterase [Pirellulales bacterium]
MNRFARRLVIVALSLTAAWSAYAWAVATPRIGEPVAGDGAAAERKLGCFGFIGDTQLGDEIVDAAFRRLHEARVDFVLHLGDIVDNAASDEQWHAVLDKAGEYQLRLRPVVGNHDRLPDDRGEARFRQFFPELPGTFYDFHYRGLHFLMLNSERSLAPWSEQGGFLAEKLEASREPTIVCLHRPVFTCGHRDWGNQALRRVWLHGRLTGSPTALVLAGHHHYYDRTRPLDGITYVTSGGGSRKLYPAETPDATTAMFRSGVNHYGIVDVFADRLEVRVLGLDGEPLDQFAVTLP